MQSSEARPAGVRLGWLETVGAPGWPGAAAAAEHVAGVEDEGFDAIWLRAAPGGGDGTLLFAAALAGLTGRVRIGIAAPPSADLHPLRLAEDLAMIDVASGGRLDWIPTHDGAMSSAENAEYVHVVVSAWRGEAFDHAGPRWPFPEISCVPSPEQRPHPPVWLGCDVAQPAAADAGLTGRWLDDRRSLGAFAGSESVAVVFRLGDDDEVDASCAGTLSASGGNPVDAERGEAIFVSMDVGRARDDVAQLLAAGRLGWLIADPGAELRDAERARTHRDRLAEIVGAVGLR